MRATVDKETCIGCELCVDTCPEVFEMDGDVARARADQVPDGQQDCASDAAENCPVEAIQIEG